MKVLLIFTYLIFYSIGVLPNWNIEKSSINLLTSDSYNYIITHRVMYDLEAKLEKYIIRLDNGTITHYNQLYINGVYKGKVSFENIETFYLINGRKLLCPMGKFHPINLDNMEEIENNDFDGSKNWDLKCFSHNSGYFFVVYLMNGENQVYDLKSDNQYIKYQHFQFHREMYDFLLVNKESGNELNNYPICALVNWDNYIKFVASKLQLTSVNHGRSRDLRKNLTELKNYSEGCFDNNTNDFFYISYDNISDFSSGFSISTVTDYDYYTVEPVEVLNNYSTPFEFMDDVDIKEMKFMLNSKYVYYSIYNTKNGKTYHGILDVKLNKVIFNTDENFDLFIPYSKNSMIAITKETAYRICLIKDINDNNNCIDECDSNNIIYDVDGNKCGINCDEGKYLIVPEGICSSECNSLIYITRGTYCGLCRDLESDNKYKILNGTECLSDIPEGAEIYNSNLFLLSCKKGYILNENICVPHCYESCETCSDYSTDENDQKCLTCKNGYYHDALDSTICKKIIPTTIPIPIPTTILEIECNEKNIKKCSKCNEESNLMELCLSCKNGYKKVNYTTLNYKYIDCLLPENPILKNFYFDEALNEYRPCYKTCKRCLTEGNPDNHNCLECIKGYMLRPGENPKNNCVVFSEFYYISPYNHYKSMDIFQCPEEAKYKIKEKKSCIDDCKKDSDYKYLYNGECVNKCPTGTTNDSFICKVNINKCTLGQNSLVLKNNNLNVTKILIKTYISEFNYTNNHITQYKNENYSIIIYKNSNCIKELSLLMPNINFTSCYTKVKKAYNITENLIISVVDKKELINPITFYSFFHPISGEKLNAKNICKDDIIILNENLNVMLNENDTYYTIQTSLTEQGINIFETSDPFFNDICYNFENPLKKDIPLYYRKKYIYPNTSECDQGCQNEDTNLEEMIATCHCKFNDIDNIEKTKDNNLLNEMIGNFFDFIDSSNILVLKCIKNIITIKNFVSSKGVWIFLCLFCIQIGMCLLYYIVEIKKMKIYIFSISIKYKLYIKNNKNINNINTPPKKVRIKENNKPIITDNANSFNSNIKIYKSKEALDNRSNTKLKNKLIEKNNNKIKKAQIFLTEKDRFHKNFNKIIINKDNLPKKNEEKSEIIVNTKNKTNKEITIFFEEYFSNSPDDMEYDDAIYFDKRTFFENFTENIKDKQIIANTFFVEDKLKPRSIKIIVFILDVILFFVINGLFFSEDVINELFEIDEEKETFFSYFPRSIKRIIDSTVVSVIIGIITDFFFVDEKKLKNIFIKGNQEKNIIELKTLQLIKEIKIRNFSFMIIDFIFSLFSFFYLLCFNYVYPYSQIEWIKSSITIIIIMQILSILKCFFESTLRLLSFKLKNEKLYKLSKLLD